MAAQCFAMLGASQKPHPPSKAKPVLYYFNVRTGGGVIEDPEGQVYSDLQAMRVAVTAKVRDMIAEGDQKGEDLRSWRIKIMDRANQPVLTMMFSEALDPKAGWLG
ncbi:DUF6894 family protein [Microvirga pakistanensis]|uniref:DUF6894 family protein n=1 Tax=Microvirga pakistanensis TaxID=1682650 RepID=UPI00106B602C|nr:hypothetical protein [Microvirga pakistanensis]